MLESVKKMFTCQLPICQLAHNHFLGVWKQNVRAGIRHIEQETCFRFHEIFRDDGRDFLNFRRAQGCWSHIGRVGGGQLVSIGFGCDYVRIF